MIADIAREAILALNIVPDEDVDIGGNLSTDWNGAPKILITTDPTKPEDVTQGGAVSSGTPLAINCVAEKRQEAWDIVRVAARAVYEHFETLENQPQSGILCITLSEYNVFQIPNQSPFQATVGFHVLHTFTL